jgi:ribonuclease HII
MLTTPRTVVRREAGIFAMERALQRRGFGAVAGADEAGRGACAGPLVVAAAVLPAGQRGEVPELADSKLLTPAARERVYEAVVAQARAYAVVVIPAADVDRRGLQVCNLAGMRRALAALAPHPDYVLTDGFAVAGLGAPGLAVWKGDRVAACIAAASVLAKVTRDRIMVELDQKYPGYGFADHKGYSTDDHTAALAERGPCPEHRFSYVNVTAALLASRESGAAALLASRESGAAALLASRESGAAALLASRESGPATAADRAGLRHPDVPVGAAGRHGRSSVSAAARGSASGWAQGTEGRTG